MKEYLPKNKFSVGRLNNNSILKMDNWLIWGGSVIAHTDNKYYMLFSRWPRETGHDGWVTHSEIACAISDTPTGPYTFIETALPKRANYWDADVTHNPTAITHNGKYYLYYTGNNGNGSYWDHRNNQRVGIAVADHPCGPWKRFDKPLIDVSPGSWDSMATTNPTCSRMPDGRFILVYKAVGDENEGPFYGPVTHGVAFSDFPIGPFEKHKNPIFSVSDAAFPGEDPFVWSQNDSLFALVKDNGRNYSHHLKAIVLFHSKNGIDWKQIENSFITRELTLSNGTSVKYDRVERPQILFQKEKATTLFCGVKPNDNEHDSFNIQIPINFDYKKQEIQ